jgi:hypothetical protein
MDLIPRAGLEAWYQIDPTVNTATSCPDFSGKGRNLTVGAGNSPELLTSRMNGQLGYYFNGGRDPFQWSGSVTAKHIFAVIAFDKRRFAGVEGVITGLTSGNVLVSQYAGTAFYPFGSAYRRNDVTYADNNQQAPMNGGFALVELVLPGGGVAMNGIQIGKQLNLSPARLLSGWFLDGAIYSIEQTDIARLKWMNYVAMRYHIWPQTAAGLKLFPFPANRQRGREQDVEHYLSEPYEGESKALVRDELDSYQWPFTLRRQEEYLAAEAFYEQHRPNKPFVMRDYRYLPPRDLQQVFASGLREQGSDVTWRCNYSFETSLSESSDYIDLDMPATNWALNAPVIASRTYAESRPEQAVNGLRHPNGTWAPYDAAIGSGWDSDQGPTGVEPADLVVPFGARRQFSHAKMVTIKDVLHYSIEPTTSETFSSYGITSYEVYFLNEGQEAYLEEMVTSGRYYWKPGAWTRFLSISNNNKVRRDHDFPYLESSAVLFRALGTADHTTSPHARLVEFEVWNRNPDLALYGPLEVLQRAIIDNQWPNGLPRTSADSYTPNGGPSVAWTSTGDSDLLTFNVFSGLTLNGYVYSPVATPPVGGIVRNAWVIMLIGHETVADGINRVKYLVDRGFHVVLLGMPNFEPNSTNWTYPHSMNGNVTINGAAQDHAQFTSVIEQDGTAILPLFLDQVFRAANWIRQQDPAAKIHLTGHSGGGFMTSMAAALDDDRYFTVKNSNAGELPFSIDDTPVHVEQKKDRPFWMGHDWQDLYAIAARYGKFTKSHNEQDMFFQARYRHHTFRNLAEDVNAVLDAYGYPGSFDIYVDPASLSHQYTNAMLQKFVDDCLAFEPGAYPVLDLVTTPLWGAYSTRRLRSAYTGPALRILDANGVQEDIYFASDGTLDTAALSGDSPYRIYKMYDQSGNGRTIDAIPNDGFGEHIPWLNTADKSIRFMVTGDPAATGFVLPSMATLLQGEAFMRRKLDAVPPSEGVGGWWKLSPSTDLSHTPYTTGQFYDQFGSQERRGPFANAVTLTNWHVMWAYSAPNDWAFGTNSMTPQATDNTNVVEFPASPRWGASADNFGGYARGYASALVIFSQKCNALDRYALIAGL